jgi:TPR repeat protein
MARYDMAFDETTHAAAGGTTDALFELGLQYSAGRGVAMDLVEAHKWFNLSAMRGNEAAKTWRVELAREMSREEIATAQRLAREWLSRH